MQRALFIFCLLIVTTTLAAQQIHKRSLSLMGSDFDITVVAKNEAESAKHINTAIAEIVRIEKLISSWDPNSQTYLINKNAGIKPVKVAAELFSLIDRALKISKLTNGAFDISYASMDKVWFFNGSMTKMPKKETIENAIKKVGYKNIILDYDNGSVFLKLKGMKIGFGAIGKGYAADKAKELLIRNNIVAGIINASGDLNAWGTQPNGKDWLIAIVNPLNKDKVFSWLPVKNSAVVTSGNYEKHLTINDVLYSHIIDPRTGYPSTGILSVSVFTKTAELADALATSIFVMGIDTGLDFINQLKGVECIIVAEDNIVLTSKNIKLNQLKKDGKKNNTTATHN